jgi:hypothetical protein
MDPDASELAPTVPPTFGVPVAMPSAIGPMIFQSYPLPGLPSEGDHFYYDREVDLSRGDFAAPVAYAAHYDFSLVVHACPDIAAIQVAHPRANIHPFSKVSPRILSRGRELFALAHSAAHIAPVVLPSIAHSMPSSRTGGQKHTHTHTHARVRRAGVCHPFFLPLPSQLHHAAQIPLPYPVLPSLYRPFLRADSPKWVVSPTWAHTAPTPTVSMLPPLLGGVGLVSGLLVLKGGDFISIVPIGSLLLQLMGGFLLTPLMGGFLLQLMGGILLMPLMWGFLLQLMGGFLLTLPIQNKQCTPLWKNLTPPIPFGGAPLRRRLLPSIAHLPSLVAFHLMCLPSSMVVMFRSLPSIFALPMCLHLWCRLLGSQVRHCVLCLMRMLGLRWLPTLPCPFRFQFLP